MKIEFYRNSGTKTYEIISGYTVEAENLSQALKILEQELTCDEGIFIDIEISNNNLYASWKVGDREYFDNYFPRI